MSDLKIAIPVGIVIIFVTCSLLPTPYSLFPLLNIAHNDDNSSTRN
ncbi:MAG: hypothetical protein F6J99_41825 [Moorea sp. SIO4G3]|nr:hypothetical protein [Moorena sp. SIO4G3]